MNTDTIKTNINNLKIVHEKLSHILYDDNDKEFLMDTFNIPDEVYQYLDRNKNKPNFLEFMEKHILKKVNNKSTFDDIYTWYKNIIPEKVITYIFTHEDSFNINDIIIENETDNTYDTYEQFIQYIDDFNWRNNQIRAIKTTISQNFVSGLHDHIMGAGKAITSLNIIYEHYKRNNKNDVYIYTCDRQEILRAMFFEKNKEGKYILSTKIIDDWKNKGIIDLNKFHIIDCVNDKPKSIFKDLHTINKPKLLIINNKFLTLRDYENILSNEPMFIDSDDDSQKEIIGQRVALVILDECHSISAPQTYKTLKFLKYKKKVPIIGFSATPLRPKAEVKLCDIFSKTFDINKKNKKLNIISTYNLVDAIQDEVILPFKYICVEVNNPSDEIAIKENRLIETNIINKVLPELPYKKIVCWNKNTTQMEENYHFYVKKYQNMKMFMSSFKDNYYTSQGYNCNLDEFYKCKTNAMLFCVNRCREGSDIEHLDCGVYLDAVKNRSILVAMQTSGRTIRPDKEGKKTHGVIIDMFVPEEGKQIESLTVEKIMGYYNSILNLAFEGAEEDSGTNEFMKQYFEFLKLKNNTYFNEETNEVTISIDNKKKHDIKIKFELTTKTTDWSFIKTELNKAVDKQFNVDKEQKFKIIIDQIKELDIMGPNTDFWEAYKNIQNKEKLGLPENIYNEYKEIWDKKTWYDVLNIDMSKWYSSWKTVKNVLNKTKYANNINEITYQKLLEFDNMLPPNPNELYRLDNTYVSIKKSFNNNDKSYF
ncbi:type III restriction enzyme, res subunit [Klosneuvirus KNV1]|uniref:Type III restriction enzyme, res subunit n=1 Tax=Klosneuvirus KNV1 TaxID=1977640 RepID=A0A1V0SJG3_9VIRU|nr:type III restriction enzyme, res subunit [Klosneuvirus KNV1]